MKKGEYNLVYGTAEEVSVALWLDKNNWVEHITKEPETLRELVVRLGKTRRVTLGGIIPTRANLTFLGASPGKGEERSSKVLAIGDGIYKILYTMLGGLVYPRDDTKTNTLRGRPMRVEQREGYQIISLDIMEVGNIPVLVSDAPIIEGLSKKDILEIRDAIIYAVLE